LVGAAVLVTPAEGSRLGAADFIFRRNFSLSSGSDPGGGLQSPRLRAPGG